MVCGGFNQRMKGKQIENFIVTKDIKGECIYCVQPKNSVFVDFDKRMDILGGIHTIRISFLRTIHFFVVIYVDSIRELTENKLKFHCVQALKGKAINHLQTFCSF